jgi:hypothetical protein
MYLPSINQQRKVFHTLGLLVIGHGSFLKEIVNQVSSAYGVDDNN